MKILVSLLSISTLRTETANYLAIFLGHRFPTVRAATAESIYLALQTEDILSENDSAEDLLLETTWSSKSSTDYAEAIHSIIQSLKEA